MPAGFSAVTIGHGAAQQAGDHAARQGDPVGRAETRMRRVSAQMQHHQDGDHRVAGRHIAGIGFRQTAIPGTAPTRRPPSTGRRPPYAWPR